MSYSLILSALALVLVLVLVIGLSIWWVQRPISPHMVHGRVLPLFSNAQAVVWRRTPAEDDDAGRIALVQLDDL